MFRALKYKFLFTMGFVHMGFFASLYGLYSYYQAAHQPGVPPYFAHAFPWLFAGVFGFYGAFMGGVLWMFAPFYPWMRRARSFHHFKLWFLEELPTILAVLTSLAALVPVLRAAWGELRKAHESGKLDFRRFSHVARRVADKAEGIFHENGEADYDEHGEPPAHPPRSSKKAA